MADQLKHIGFIVDGNRRWARARGLPTFEGHRRGFDKVETMIETLRETEVEFASFYLFSTENWDRSPEEVAYLMDMANNQISRMIKRLEKENIRCLIMGRPEPVEPKLWQKLKDAETRTKDNTGLTVCICFNYGGHWEIADAATKILAEHMRTGETNSDANSEITPEEFRRYLYHPEVPDLDLLVRTSGEERISSFLLWRAAYSEFLWLEKNFPDIEAEDCLAAIEEFHNRNRRFGK